EGTVPVIIRVYGDRHVAEHRLGPRRRDDDEPTPRAWLACAAARRAAPDLLPGGHRVPQVVELALRVHALGLLIRERGQAPRAPVDDVVAPVDQPLLIEADEDLAHGAGEARVQGEPGPREIEGAADRLQL